MISISPPKELGFLPESINLFALMQAQVSVMLLQAVKTFADPTARIVRVQARIREIDLEGFIPFLLTATSVMEPLLHVLQILSLAAALALQDTHKQLLLPLLFFVEICFVPVRVRPSFINVIDDFYYE